MRQKTRKPEYLLYLTLRQSNKRKQRSFWQNALTFRKHPLLKRFCHKLLFLFGETCGLLSSILSKASLGVIRGFAIFHCFTMKHHCSAYDEVSAIEHNSVPPPSQKSVHQLVTPINSAIKPKKLSHQELRCKTLGV